MAEERGDVPQKKNVFLTFLFTVISVTLYTSFWYFTRADQFYNLATKKKLVKILPAILLVFKITFFVCLIAFSFTLNPTEMGSFYREMSTAQAVILLLLLVSLIVSFLLKIVTALYTRTIINQALENKGVNKGISILFTLVFTHLYLQYEINRIIDDKEHKPRTAPWVLFILVLIGLIVGVLLLI